MLNEANKRVMAIDYGSKRVGIAVSDPLCLFPSLTITFPNNEKIFTEIKNLILEKNVNRIVLGYPYNESAATSELGREILKFKSYLEDTFKIKIDLWDENLTSKMAQSRIMDSVTKKSKRRNKSLVDSHSAAIILEEYLSTLKSN